MTTRHKVKTEAERLDVAVLVDRDSIDMFAPPGHVFGCTGNHIVFIPQSAWGNPLPRGDGYKAAVEDLSYGIRECEEHDCELCQEMQENSTIDRMGMEWVNMPDWAAKKKLCDE